MNPIQITKSIIEQDERLSTIRLNTKTNNIEIGDKNIMSYDYEYILEKFKEKYPMAKITKQHIEDIVYSIARENKYEPENKHKNLCPWYDKYQVDDKGKILHTIYNILVLFVNDTRFKGKFSIGKIMGYNGVYEYETYNNKFIEDHNISEFRSICEEELGFNNKHKIKCAIQILAHNNDIVKEILKNMEK